MNPSREVWTPPTVLRTLRLDRSLSKRSSGVTLIATQPSTISSDNPLIYKATSVASGWGLWLYNAIANWAAFTWAGDLHPSTPWLRRTLPRDSNGCFHSSISVVLLCTSRTCSLSPEALGSTTTSNPGPVDFIIVIIYTFAVFSGLLK